MIRGFVIWLLLVLGLLFLMHGATRSEKPKPDENGDAGAGA